VGDVRLCNFDGLKPVPRGAESRPRFVEDLRETSFPLLGEQSAQVGELEEESQSR